MSLCAMFVEGPTWETIGLGEASDLDWLEPFNETAFSKHRKGIWLLKTSIIGNYCISHSKGQFSTPVANLTCLGQRFYNIAQKTQWWGAPNHTGGYIGPVGSKLTQCYLSRWFGLCILGSIRPSFFLRPLIQGEKLGVPIYEEKRVPYKLAVGKITNGFPGELWSCHLAGRWILGQLHFNMYAQLHHQATGCCWNYN
jgi:hypothetical protein